MRYLIVTILLGSLLSCQRQLPPSKLIQEKDRVRLEITGSITQEQLKEYTRILEEDHDIHLDTEGTAWTGDGTLEMLVMEVDCGEGFKGVASATEESLLQGRAVGFERNYTSKDKPFQIGNL